MAHIKVNIIIAGRTYPLTVKNTKEEEGMRKAANAINDLIFKFEQNYAVKDKQDVLAMSALQFASKIEIENLKKATIQEDIINKIENLTKLVNTQLK